MVPFSFAGQELSLLRCGALYWPREQALLVADLHLEKGSFFARFGQLLPPYDSRETLDRLALAIRQSGARRVLCLGDSFHDADGADRLEPYAAGMLAALTRAVDWVWITGNHDADVTPREGGTRHDELELGGITLRHQARTGAAGLELSGHFHPRLKLSLRGRRIVRPCTVASESRLILPAFGAFTGGMDAADPAILSAMQPARTIRALVSAGGKLVEFPLWQAA
jgi:DNA ligase-associated metallophosphoesterase